jgi:molybdopterin converting factor small subunit
MEPPFSILTKKSNDILTFEKELKLIELLEYFQEKYGEEFKNLIWDKEKKEELHKMLSIIINGRSYRYDGFLNTLLKDGDDISFIYIFFGG